MYSCLGGIVYYHDMTPLTFGDLDLKLTLTLNVILTIFEGRIGPISYHIHLTDPIQFFVQYNLIQIGLLNIVFEHCN